MEELIEIIINMIGRWLMSGKQPAAPQRTAQAASPKPKPSGKIPSNRAVVTANMPVARRKVLRRPVPPNVAIAAPIITGSNPAIGMPAPIAPARSIAAAAIASSHTGTAKSAVAIRKWLNPATLKKEFILTEIFRPPLSLRNGDEMGHP